MANGPNPILLVRDHMPEYIADLEAEQAKTVERLREINAELAVARTLQEVVTRKEPT